MITNKGGDGLIRMKCPVCGKRLLDISKLPKEQVSIEVKSPCCRKIVNLKLIKENIKEIRSSKGI